MPVRKHKVLRETDTLFILGDGTEVKKATMRNNYAVFFTDEYAANVVRRRLNPIVFPSDENPESNFNMTRAPMFMIFLAFSWT